jgi:WD40 repeat protein
MASKQAQQNSFSMSATSICAEAFSNTSRCVAFLLLLACILAFNDRWLLMPLAAEEITVVVILLVLPLLWQTLCYRHARSEKQDEASLEDSSEAPCNGSSFVADPVAKVLASPNTEEGVAEEQVAARPTLQPLATASLDGTVRLWSFGSSQSERRLEDCGSAVNVVSWSADNATIATGSSDGAARIWDAATGACKHALDDCGGVVCSVALSPCSGLLLTGTDDHCLRCWSLAAPQEEPDVLFEGHEAAVSSVAFSPCGAYVASGSLDGSARIWRADSGDCVHVLQGHMGEVFTVAFATFGDMLATGSQDGTVCLWSVGAGWRIIMLEGHTAGVRSLAFSPCDGYLCTGSADGSAKLWDVQTGQCQWTYLSATGSPISSVAYSADGFSIALAEGNVARICDAHTGESLMVLEGHSDRVQSVSASR